MCVKTQQRNFPQEPAGAGTRRARTDTFRFPSSYCGASKITFKIFQKGNLLSVCVRRGVRVEEVLQQLHHGNAGVLRMDPAVLFLASRVRQVYLALAIG